MPKTLTISPAAPGVTARTVHLRVNGLPAVGDTSYLNLPANALTAGLPDPVLGSTYEAWVVDHIDYPIDAAGNTARVSSPRSNVVVYTGVVVVPPAPPAPVVSLS